MKSINPSSGETVEVFQDFDIEKVQSILQRVQACWLDWKKVPFASRSQKMHRLAQLLRDDKDRLGRLITTEMGKPIRESVAEVEKSAWVCDYYAEEAEGMLADESFESDGSRAFASFEPLGIVLAVMPWNFPFWQVFRFAAPGLMAGNAAVLKHASNVCGCAMEIEDLFRRAGFPDDLFRTLLIPSSQVRKVIEDPRVKAATLTGSEPAGSAVASQAGKCIKKTVLELGGSDPYIVLEDADLERCAQTAVTARMMNAGQSCIAAKRFLVARSIHDDFVEKIVTRVKALRVGDPQHPETDMGPLARKDLRDDIHDQVLRSKAMGAKLLCGGEPLAGEGCFYAPTVMTDITPDMPVFNEETFGPVLPIVAFDGVDDVINLANQSDFGLGGSLWTQDLDYGIQIARQIQTGAVFINGMTKSDPRIPFGGIGISGYGRELSHYGIKEFVNIKTIWVGR